MLLTFSVYFSWYLHQPESQQVPIEEGVWLITDGITWQEERKSQSPISLSFLRWLTDAFTFESTTIFQPFSALLNAHLALAPSPPSLPHHPRPPPLLLLLIHLHPLSHRTRPTSSHCGRRTGRGGGSSRSRGSSKGRGSSVPDLKKPTSTFSYVYTHCRKEEEGGGGQTHV